MLWFFLLLPVSLPHPSDSPAAYLKLIKGALWGASPASPIPSSPPVQLFLRPIGKRFHSWLTAAHLFSLASSSTLLGERRLSAGERSSSGLLQRGCEETKAAPRAAHCRTYSAVKQHRDSRQRNTVTQITVTARLTGLYSDELRTVRIDSMWTLSRQDTTAWINNNWSGSQ